MITATKTPRKQPSPRSVTPAMFFSGCALNGLVISQAEHLLHDQRADYEKLVRGLCRTAFDIGHEMARRAAS